MTEPAVYTVEEAAERLRIGRTLAYELARRGELPVVRLGRTLRVPRHALEQMLTAAAADPSQTNGAGETAPQEKEVSASNGHRTTQTGPGRPARP